MMQPLNRRKVWNMKKTKQAAAILAALFILLGLPYPVRVHASGNVTISVSSPTLNIGDTVTVTAWAAGPNGEAAIAKLGFNYDSGKLSFVSCSESEYTGGGDGYVGVTGNNVSVTLKATASGVASVTVSGSNGVSASDGATEYGEMSAGGTKLTINEGAGGTQQNNPEGSGDTTEGADNANKSEDNSLASLSISPGTLSPAFQYSQTNYTASVPEDVTSINVEAKPSHEKATVESITGQTDLKPGENTVNIVVKAENGTSATYKIIVTRGGEAKGEQEGNQDGSQQEKPEGITLNGNPFNLAPAIPDEVVPKDFTKITISCQGQQVEGLQFDKAPLKLVYLTTPSTEVKNTLAVYDEASGNFSQFRKVEIGEKYIILLDPPAETGLPAAYAQSAASVEGIENVPVFTSQDAPEFSLIYGASSFGNMGWYQYDGTEGFFQRYAQPAAVQQEPSEEGAVDNSVELQSLQNAYKNLEEQLNERKTTSRRITAIMVFVIAVLVVVIVNLVLRGRQNREEEDFFEEVPKQKKRRHAHTEKGPDDKRPGKKQKPEKEVEQASRQEANPGPGQRKEPLETPKALKKPAPQHRQEPMMEPKAAKKPAPQRRQEPIMEPKAAKKPAPQHCQEPTMEPKAAKKPAPQHRQGAPMDRKDLKKPIPEDDFEVIDLEDL